MAFQFGDVVIVEGLLDPQGRNPKDRGCVIVTPPGQIEEGGSLDVVAITTLLPDPRSPSITSCCPGIVRATPGPV